jgi:hypothetical protein
MKYIRKQKAMEFLNVGESSIRQFIQHGKLTPYQKKGTEAFFLTKQVYKIIEDRKSDQDFIKEMPTTNERKLRHHQEQFITQTMIDVLETTIGKSNIFNSDHRNEIIEMVIKTQGDFTYVANMYSMRRTYLLKIFKKAMAIHLSRFNRVAEMLELEKKYENLQDEYQNAININKELVSEIETLTSIKKMDAEANLNIMAIKIEDLPLSVRAYNCLRNGNVKNLYDLSKMSISQIKKFRNVGTSTIYELSNLAKEYGFTIKN